MRPSVPAAAVRALLLAALALAALPPATALVIPKFGGAKGVPHGSGHATPEAPGAAPGATAATQGAGARAGRVPHPELLRAAAEQAEAQARAAPHSTAYTATPWPGSPHLRVRLSGDAARDALLLKGLRDELAAGIDADRLHAASLADDALSDDALARALPRAAPAQRQFLRLLRRGPPEADAAALQAALRPLAGHTLLLMAHVDPANGALVFKGADGRQRRAPLAALEEAARSTEVQLLVVGCKSARHASAGFADNLNSLDAARVLALAVKARPGTLFDLFSALSSESMPMLLDPQRFQSVHSAELTAGTDGAALSTVYWWGPPSSSAAGGALAGPVDRPAVDPAPVDAAASALPALCAAAVLSWLAGAVLGWRTWSERRSRLAWLAGDALGHALLLPLWLAVLAEAVSGAADVWWAGGAALALPTAAALTWHVAGHDAAIRGHRAVWYLMALRLAVMALPLLAVAALHAGVSIWPLVMHGLRALYALGRPLPNPWVIFAGLGLIYWVGGMLWGVVQRIGQGRQARRAHAARQVLWRDWLVADGVVEPTAQRSALAARSVFERGCARRHRLAPRWDMLHHLAMLQGADPWTGQALQRWWLVILPMQPLDGAAQSTTVHGLLRVGARFVHVLPRPLVERWREKQLPAEALPQVLHQVESRLRRDDFMPAIAHTRLKGLMVFGGLMVATVLGLAGLPGWGTDASWFGLAAAGLLFLTLVVWPGVIWARRHRHHRWLATVQPAAQAGVAGRPATEPFRAAA